MIPYAHSSFLSPVQELLEWVVGVHWLRIDLEQAEPDLDLIDDALLLYKMEHGFELCFPELKPVILRLLRPTESEMSQPYWSWGLDVPECDAPCVAPSICKDLDELNFVVQQLRNEVAVLHREKGELEERVLRLKKCTIHADSDGNVPLLTP
ncbi:hypothetical protein L3X38_026788 [Prunus dulcis]|uniref:Uncharacterized protein n=1 Tax=Prunus dulcis TaxID=3755 RepID=A0AAD4VP73_PRUDU|nr:hypothetical protein L3X38_026788 [Prunus dulcis]